MRHMLCGSRNRNGRECRAFPVRGSRRCKWHGGMSTGPLTPEGKLRCYWAGIGAWLAAGGRPHRGPNRTAAERQRLAEAKLNRRIAWRKRQERREAKAEHRRRKERLAAGLPLLTPEGWEGSDNEA
jgi:hypothetical protein